MSHRYLDVARDGHVVTCTFSNPPHHTLTAGGVLELFQVLNDVEADASVRALVFTGAGEGVFIAHYEVGELSDTAERNIEAGATAGSSEAREPELHGMHQLCLRLERMSAITIAAMNGNFDRAQGAFYYVRVLQNPTCRWSTYDALRLGREPDPRAPATLRERAWSSPIWIDASK